MNTPTVRSAVLVLLLALSLAVTAWIYWPGINGPSMLDDRSSVLVLNVLDESPQYAMDYIFGDTSGPLGRPVSILSFVLEKLYLNEGISGGKKVNIVLHLVNGCLVMWLFNMLLAHIGIPAHRSLSLLLGTAWLVSPLYVSTVLYVVQRMAMLATFFMLAAAISYCHWRIGVIQRKQGILSLPLVFVFLLCAIYSKENAIVIVPVLLLLEVLWFQFLGPNGQVLKWLRVFTIGSIATGFVFVCLFFTLGHWLSDAYRFTSFTPAERMLTETRILWDYVGQLIFPDVSKMGVYHDDIVISKSMVQPMNTLYAVLGWIFVVISSFALLKHRKGRYWVFGMAIFLIGHSTESTILPLELYYEHRNYFPGVGLFLSIAVLLGSVFSRWPEVKSPILVWGGVLILVLAMRTSSQVQIWSSAPILYLNNVNAHPKSFRTNSNMASELASVGALESALVYSAVANSVNSHETPGDYYVRDARLSCIARKPLPPERAAALRSINTERPLTSVASLNAFIGLLQNNQCASFDTLEFANHMASLLLDEGSPSGIHPSHSLGEKASPNVYAMLAVLENALERYDKAYQYTERFLSGSPGNVRGLLMKLHFATALRKGDEIELLLAQLQALEDAGALSLADEQTLSLYKEDDD